MRVCFGCIPQAVLKYQNSLGFDSSKIATSVRARAAQLFRCGCLLGATHVGDPCETDAIGNLWDDLAAPVKHATGVPGVDCHVIGITGEFDVCWPPRLVARWRDLPARGYDEVELAGTSHEQLRNSPRAMAKVFGKLGELASERAEAARRWVEIVSVVALADLP